jgi:hypothetical protein
VRRKALRPLLLPVQAGDASGTGLLDVAARVWQPQLAAMIDDQLASWLPRLIGPDEVCVCVGGGGGGLARAVCGA